MIIHNVLVVVLLYGGPAASKGVDRAVSVNSKTVYVRGPNKITVNGYASKLGPPEGYKVSGATYQDTFVGQMKNDGMQSSISSVTYSLKHKLPQYTQVKKKAPVKQKWKSSSRNKIKIYKTPYIPIKPFYHRQVIFLLHFFSIF